ncbi:MAG: pyridoxal phosphate-dependent aminotransferase [Terriglobales bacterium]
MESERWKVEGEEQGARREPLLSRRTGWPLAPNRLHELALARRAAGTLLDLTQSNPTVCGFHYPEAALRAALAQPAAMVYEPAPQGLAVARRAIAAYYAGRGLELSPERLVLTASTSEAYALLFRLLGDPGDAVVMPTPSYPLFEMLATAHDLRLQAAPMEYAGRWELDFEALAAAEAATKAVLLVHPNNPTGAYLSAAAWERVQALAAGRGWAVVVDEVFFDYPLEQPAVALELERVPALTFVLNGLSKLAALPQMKLAWIGVFGPEPARRAALARLEVLNDLFLSAGAPIQHAAAAVLASRGMVQEQIRARLRQNLASLDRGLAARAAAGVTRLRVEGGWNAVLRLPRVRSDEAWAELAVERAGVLTHPGHFYGFTAEAHLVVSLLPPEADFARGVDRLLQLE